MTAALCLPLPVKLCLSLSLSPSLSLSHHATLPPTIPFSFLTRLPTQQFQNAVTTFFSKLFRQFHSPSQTCPHLMPRAQPSSTLVSRFQPV
ncbi:hypothetical protein BKA81DRAFT_345980 [Phyllosticta paracitricarpa]